MSVPNSEAEKFQEWKVAMAEMNRQDMFAYSRMTVLEKWRDLQSLFHFARSIHHPWDDKCQQDGYDRLADIRNELARTARH